MITSAITRGHARHPVAFEEFFEQGSIDSLSPFLTPESRLWGINLTLKSSLLAAVFLLVSFILAYYPQMKPFSNILLITVYFLAGVPALIEAIEDLMNFDINIDILMTVAAFSSVLIGSGFEGGLLLVLFALSGAMEDAVTLKAKGAISSLNKLSPTRATVVEGDGTLIEKSVKEILPGTVILIKAGQLVPLDGVVIAGNSSVNLVHLTGENFPISKGPHDQVPAGARNLDGSLTLTVTRTSSDSTLSRIIELVTQAQDARPKLQRWFDKLSQSYAITIIILSALFALIFPFLLHIPFLGVEGSVYRALTFLIAASPCALIIAIPIAYLSAISICAKKGILLKGGIALDALASCKAIALDKTGTLTTGDLTLVSIDPLTSTTNLSSEVLGVAYALEKNAIHPIAKAIMNFAQKQKIQSVPLKNFRSFPGQGLEAIFNNVPVAIGRPEFIGERASVEQRLLLYSKIEAFKARGELVSILLMNTDLYIFRFTDTIRQDIKNTLQSLQKQNVELYMLTGDHAQSAKRVANELGIKKFNADLKPEDKLNIVSELSKTKGLAMVGDGINDAPALARASVGICMGKVGSTTAIDAADIILLRDNIELLDWLMNKARQTQAIVRQNLLIAAGAILIATTPALTGMIPLWLAVVLHEGGTVLVGLNALRLLRD
jgi:heavy metal translocating P-type ATPase